MNVIDLDKPEYDFEQSRVIDLNKNIQKDFHSAIDFVPEERTLIIEEFKQMAVFDNIMTVDGVLKIDGKLFIEA